MKPLELTKEIVRLALELGATDAECTLAEGEEFSVSVRLGDIEKLQEAASRSAGLRVLVGQRSGSAYTSDLSDEGIQRMVRAAVDNAEVTGEDPFAGLPDAADLGQHSADLSLFDEGIASLTTPEKIEQAKRAEAAFLAYDPRIDKSEGASYDSGVSSRYFANSRGFAGGYRSSQCSLSAVPVASQGGAMERDYWYSSARSPRQLDTPENIGIIAAQRTLRRLGARKVATQKAAIVFEPRMARMLLSHIGEAVDGDAVYRDSSFLAGKIGQRIASENVTIIDDGTMPGLWGTSPFDAEGVRTRRTVIVEKGILRSYLLNTYTARKLGLRSTGNAGRGLSGAAYVQNGNFYLEAGSLTPAEVIRQAGTGLYVTEVLGNGVNVVNGDYSCGAQGLWIENGELAYPVSEVTIASTLMEMLNSITAIGNDLEFQSTMAAPTLLIREMTISGT
ncbi:MAG: TldD/PmbA family protein [Bryobacteraceae bacterium]|nr:TldD/PmbA family protein [Bryobacteraceae bacterium]